LLRRMAQGQDLACGGHFRAQVRGKQAQEEAAEPVARVGHVAQAQSGIDQHQAIARFHQQAMAGQAGAGEQAGGAPVHQVPAQRAGGDAVEVMDLHWMLAACMSIPLQRKGAPSRGPRTANGMGSALLTVLAAALIVLLLLLAILLVLVLVLLVLLLLILLLVLVLLVFLLLLLLVLVLLVFLLVLLVLLVVLLIGHVCIPRWGHGGGARVRTQCPQTCVRRVAIRT